MNRNIASVPELGRSTRLVALGLAAGCVALVQGAVLGVFEGASPQRWLAPTPVVLQAKAQCDALSGRGERTHCAQALVARGLAGAGETHRVAAR